MTREQLFEAIGALDEAMLDQNVEELKPRRNFGWIAGIAACAALIAGVVFLPRILPEQQGIVPQSGTATADTTENTAATEFVGFLDGVNFYPLSEDSAFDAVCTDGEWLAPKLGESAYFVLNETVGLYQFVDPLSSAQPETGTYTIKDNVITALSYDGEDYHKLRILDGYALELTESTSWAQLTGRFFTSRYDAQQPFADIEASDIRNLSYDFWEITLDDAQMEEFAGYLRGFVRYQEILAEEITGGEYLSFDWKQPDGSVKTVSLSNRLLLDGKHYLPDTETRSRLFEFLRPFAVQAQEEYENTPKTLPYLQGVTYRMLDSGYSYDSAYNSFTAAIGFDMKITFRSGNFRIVYLNPTWQEERGTFTIEDGFVICTTGETTHRFEILDDYTIQFASSTNENITSDNFKDRKFTCRLFPEEYFAAQVTDAEDIQCGIRKGEEVISVQLPENQIPECLDALHEITVYSESIGELSQNIVDTANMHYLFIDREGDTQDVQVYIGKYIAINGKLYVYETDTAEALLEFFKSCSTEDIPDPAQVLDNLEDFSRAVITHYVLGEHREMTDEEFAELKALLRNIVILEEDTSGEIYFGDTLTYTLYKENGVSVTIQPGGNLITIGSKRYHTEYAPCEALNQFGHNILGTRFAEPDYQPTAEKTEADAIFGIMTNYVSASVSCSDKNLPVSGEKLDALLETLGPIEILGKYTGDPLIGDSPTIILTGSDQSEITIIPCHEQIWVDGTWYSCKGTEQLLEFCQNHERD